ncbi:orexin [Dunckerocampus dactyliophorus]|uniref:orexin n=1 Tax=Dunckerocampus dactyliophorus TaxID=161453 RepID=UPI002404FB3C|nr:orexin [Dunckerocampus dactyliophorus]
MACAKTRYKRYLSPGRMNKQMPPSYSPQKMRWFTPKLQHLAGSHSSNKKVLVLLLLLLQSQAALCDAHGVSSECCRQPSRPCRLHLFLCRSGGTETVLGDASAGILTLGKRTQDEHTFQSRLQQLLHESTDRSAGILTMGRRAQPGVKGHYAPWAPPSDVTVTPLPI